jgi:GntR family transcriptional regulator/MocR family aminotransferase
VASSWAISGIDLHIEIADRRVRAGLEDGLREAVRTGRLPAGTRLPSSRQLAADLGLARNTVADAYGQLVAEGWLIARPGSGTRVAGEAAAVTDRPATADVMPAPRYDLRPGAPDVSAFPAAAWLTALRKALAAAPASALGYADPRGLPMLRTVLAGYLARVRGVRVEPDRIIVCSGFTQGLALLSQVLSIRGAGTVAIENYGQPAHRDILHTHHLATVPLPVDSQGAVVEQLAGADALLLTPAHQFPLGRALAPARRSAAAGWAARTGGLVIEDDYDGEFRYDRHPVGALQALAPEHTAYLGTASKALAPGVRLGWLVPPANLMDDLVAAKAVADGHTSSVDQLALAQLITCGGYDRHVRRMRLAYRRRRDQLARTITDAVPQARLTGIAAGLHALLTLPEGTDEASAVAAAARRGLGLDGLDSYRAGLPDHRPALVVGYATPPDHAYSGALARLVAALTG